MVGSKTGLFLLLVCGCAALAWAQDLTFSATVDRTKVEVGGQIQLTLTVSGDLEGLALPPFEFPEGWAVAGHSQSSSFSIRAGVTERSLNLVYALIPQQAGTFQFGPFTVQHHQQEFQTEPLQITVTKSALPPTLDAQGGRFTL